MKKNTMAHLLDSAEVDQKKPVADRISELPNDIIESILSKVNLRDAIRTGVLSHRWKHMWEYRTGSLDFNLGFKPERQYSEGGELIRGDDKAKYIRAVNKILNVHKGSTIQAFNVPYDLDVRNKFDIDTWIKFALRRKVRSLELNFNPPDPDVDDFMEPYIFPLPLLEKSNLSSLRSLILHRLRFTVEGLNHLLLNCPFLESLCVENVSSRGGVRLVACPKLKHLEIGHWSKFLEISSAPNLKSLRYTGSKFTRLSVENVPNLTYVSLGGSFCRPIVEDLRKLPSFLFQLKKLTLELRAIMMFPQFDDFPELNNVNELKLTCHDSDNRNAKTRDISSCASIINACPNLYKVSVQFNEVLMNDEADKKRVEWRINKCLKVVELELFRGADLEFDFFECLLSSAPSLDKIIVDISHIYDNQKKGDVDYSLRWSAEQLSPSAELVIKS